MSILSKYMISCKNILRNASVAKLYQEALLYEKGTKLSSSGALVALSGKKTGRSPSDKRIVEHPSSKENIWWGNVNKPISECAHNQNKQTAINFFNTCEKLYVVDGFAGWEEGCKIKVRVVTTRAYHALFMHNMLVRPTNEELTNFGEPDYVVFNAGQTKADTNVKGVTSETSISLSFEQKEMVILGSEYAGEMKKGIFTIMNYLIPLQGDLSMHCSATAKSNAQQSIVLFGLSGTGKTTLSADPNRDLIGDDEHIWSQKGVSNIEGGCYAKVIDLSKEKEPDIFGALNFGAVLENVVCDESNTPDYTDTSITQNTRGSYPIEFITNSRIPCVSGHPSDIVFLTCDAFGVLPPVARLSTAHAMFHFISGYTAKIAGTEMGVTEPQATFSACFGAPFLVWHPMKYAKLLAEKIEQYKTNVWLINTGWSGGAYGVGERIKLQYSRAIVDAINLGKLKHAPTETDARFGFDIIFDCPGVPSGILNPKDIWQDEQAYHQQANQLAQMFIDNFATYSKYVDENVRQAVPKLI